MISRFFIDRPIFASVLSIIFVLAGGVAVFSGMLGVTAFGVFLTPVFFYVIQGFGETRLFASWQTRLVVSCVLGLLLGLAGGYLLGRLGVGPLVWAVPVGGCAGLLGVLALPKAQRLLFRPERRP